MGLGDVSQRGFDALRLSILGARRVFGPDAFYAVCVNSLPSQPEHGCDQAMLQAIAAHWDKLRPDIARLVGARMDVRPDPTGPDRCQNRPGDLPG